MIDWFGTDFTKTIGEWDFTRMATANFERLITSDTFQDMDAETIFSYLLRDMELVSFKDYLKRYIVERIGERTPLKEIPDQMFYEILETNFRQNHAPWSFRETKKKLSQKIKSWLSQDSARRSTVFLLGFGLRMPESDVSVFLTKVLKEEDFDFQKPDETVYWYCYHFSLPYSKAREILNLYEADSFSLNTKSQIPSASEWDSIIVSHEFQESPQKCLEQYLLVLKANGNAEHQRKTSQEEFQKLYDRSLQCIQNIYREDLTIPQSHLTASTDTVGPADIEKMLYSGIPQTSAGNLRKDSESLQPFDGGKAHHLNRGMKAMFLFANVYVV